jgi:hypothetical protein
MSHELSIGVSVGQGGQKKNRREINIPSVVNGKQVSQKKAEEAYFGTGKEGKLNKAQGRKKSPNKKNVTKSFKNVKAATKAAKTRSKAADKTHNPDGTKRKK